MITVDDDWSGADFFERFNQQRSIAQMRGATIRAIQNTPEQIEFTLDDGRVFRMFHNQDCCEEVQVEEIVGDLNDLIGHPLILCEEVESEGERVEYDSKTWTFYKLSTIKGSVTIRWLGSSNGYYSESVDVMLVGKANE